MAVLAAFLLMFTLGQPDLDATLRELERANFRRDVSTLSRIREELRSALGSAGADEHRLRYALAYTDWRLSSLVDRERDEEAYKALLEEAEDQLEALLEKTPDDAEAQALYGTVNGNLITGMWSGMRRGPRAGRAYDRARELAPENPRVALQEGISRLFRPKMAGGSVEQAEKDLRRALALFDKEDSRSPWPNWGHVEIYGWLGYALVKQGKLPEARVLYEKALALEPDYRWVRESLLPELEAAETSESRPK